VNKKTLVISNLAPGDETFDSDVGSWNVTRAAADCAKGMHKAYTFDVAEVLPFNQNIEVDDAKIASMVADRARFEKSPPPIFAVEHGKIYLIEGHHRLRALARLGEPQFLAYVIEEKDGARYRVYFNGDRVSPWRR
jgi:ParB-like nuclease family protein